MDNNEFGFTNLQIAALVSSMVEELKTQRQLERPLFKSEHSIDDPVGRRSGLYDSDKVRRVISGFLNYESIANTQTKREFLETLSKNEGLNVEDVIKILKAVCAVAGVICPIVEGI